MKYRAIWEGKFRLVVAALVLACLGYVVSLQDAAKVSAQTGPYTLTVQPQYPNRPGQDLEIARISSNSGAIDCGLGSTDDCSAQFYPGTPITLTGSVLGGNNDIRFIWYPVTYSPTPGTMPVDQFCGENNTGDKHGYSCTGTMPTTNVTIGFSATSTQAQPPAEKVNPVPGTGASQKPNQPQGEVKGAKTDKTPEAPKASVQVNNKTYGPGEKIHLQSDQSLKLSGQTIPNGKVTLYLFSDPQVFSTMADPEGYWEYEIASVPPGDHHIEAEVTDPVTNKTSERTYVTDLNVEKINEMAPQINTNSVRETGIRSMVIGAAVAAAVIVAIAAVSVSVYHRKKLRRVRAQVSRRLKTVKRKR